MTQNRIIEKIFLRDNGFTTAPFFIIENHTDFEKVTPDLFPAIIKIARFGYDGKGQERVQSIEEAKKAFHCFNAPCVIEKMLTLDLEVSVVMARSNDGSTACYSLAENQHTNGILDVSIVPARTTQNLLDEARQVSADLAKKLDYVGVLTIEFFICQGKLLVNEIAPRPHNSGHFTIDACVTSQYEQQVRAMCVLPLGSTSSYRPSVMVNLLGDLWFKNGPESIEPDWRFLTKIPNLKLHLYGKTVARPGRKMGHFVVVNDVLNSALSVALDARHKIEIT